MLKKMRTIESLVVNRVVDDLRLKLMENGHLMFQNTRLIRKWTKIKVV